MPNLDDHNPIRDWPSIVVPWPRGQLVNKKGEMYNSADPWEHYAPWLEKNVGTYRIDWYWDSTNGGNSIRLYFRQESSKISFACLKWSAS